MCFLPNLTTQNLEDTLRGKKTKNKQNYADVVEFAVDLVPNVVEQALI